MYFRYFGWLLAEPKIKVVELALVHVTMNEDSIPMQLYNDVIGMRHGD